VLVAALGLAASSAQAAFPGKNGKIAYRKYSVYPDPIPCPTNPDNPNCNNFTRGDIWAMNPKGSGDTDLTNSTGTADGGGDGYPQPSDPAFSPDGTKIAYEGPDSPYDSANYCGRSTDIFVMNADGSGRQNITNTFAPPDLNTCGFDPLQAERDPAFSADGTKVAYVRGDNQIFVIGANGTGPPDQLTGTGENSEPAFSPDGTKIAFLRRRTAPGFESSQDVWVIDLRTGLQTPITGGGAPAGQGPVAFGLDYSPDGTQILYVSSGGTISVMNSADGTLVNDTGVGAFDDGFQPKPVFSPDGTKIAYLAPPDPPDPDFYDGVDIWVMDADGTNRLDATSLPREPFIPTSKNYESDPAWQPIPGATTTPPPATTPPSATTAPPTATTAPPTATITPLSVTTPDTIKPVLSSFSLSPVRFRAASSGPSISAALGTRVSYKLSEKAAVNFRVERAVLGRFVGGRCVRPKRSNRTKRRCTRYVTLRGSFTDKGKAGKNSFKFRGRLGGRKLRPGRYRLRAVATDPAKNRSQPKRVILQIVRH